MYVIHSNSQHNFNYNSIHSAYNVYSARIGQGNFIPGSIEVNRQIRLTWRHTDWPPPLPLSVPVCLEIFSISEVLFDVAIRILICNKNPKSFDVLFKVVRWNRKTFLFSFCFLFLLFFFFFFLYHLDWFRDISFVFQPIPFKLGR